MSDDAKSIEDLKIIIDGSAEKFKSAIDTARGLVNEFVGEGNDKLALFDKTFNALGGGADAIRGKLGNLLSFLGPWGATLSAVASAAESIFKAAGAEEQFNSIKDAAGGLISALGEALPAAAGRTSSAFIGMALASADADNSMTMKKSKGALEELTDRAVTALHALQAVAELAKDPSARTDVALEAGRANIQKNISDIDRELQQFADPSWFIRFLDNWGVYTEAGLQAAKEKAQQGLDELSEILREKNRAAAFSALPIDDRSGFQDILDLLDKQLTDLERKKELFGKAAGEAAAMRARWAAEDKAGDSDFELNEQEKAEQDERIAKIEKEATALDGLATARREAEKAKQLEKQSERILAVGEREIVQLTKKAELTRAGVAETAAATKEEQLLLSFRQAGIPVTDELMARIKALAQATGEAAAANAQAQREMQRMAEIGNTVSSSLDSAFRQWTRGATVNVKQMVADIIAEMARLTLLRTVLNPLFGGGDVKGGGLVGGALSSLFGGFRAEGGPVEAGKAYIVGERGEPEVLFPGESGTIVPANKLGGGTTIIINAQGAYPESIADIKKALAGVEASIPGKAVQAMQEFGSRAE